MLPGKTITPHDIFGVLRRRRWLVLLPFALGLIAAPFVARRILPVYKSETLIMVVPQRVPDSYVKSTVTATVEDRLPSISDQILSRSRLERVIGDFELYEDLRQKAPMEDVVRQMRIDIGPVQIQPGGQSFRVSYLSRDPVVAQKVAARLASLFIEENSQDRENLAQSTNVFLESQLEEAKGHLVDHERKLEAYRRQHAGELPSQLESNLRAIQTAQLQLQSVSESANRARERRLLLERQLVDAQTLPVSAAPSNASSAENQATLPVAQQLEVAEKSLDALKLRFTADHPDVRRMERTVRELREKADEEAKRPRPATPSPDAIQSPAEQARLRRVRDLQADIDVIDHQLATSQAEELRLKTMIQDYQQKVEVVPTRESELVELTRDYDILKKTYDSLLVKREDSKLAANLERRQIGEQFRILDPASLPVRPANQMKRIGLSLSAAVAGLFFGLVVSGLLFYFDSSFAREEDVLRALDMPVLATVPAMASDTDRRRTRFRGVLVDAVGTAMMLGALALVAWGFLRS